MAKKIFKFLSIGLFFLVIFSLNFVFAKNDKHQDIPEIDGIYDVPGMPGMKVRVFVHREKPDKPGKPEEEKPALVCKLDDPNSNAVVDKAGWKLPSKWTYNLNPSSVPSSVGSKNLATIAGSAFSQWTNAISEVSIYRGQDVKINRKAYDGKNIIAWGRAPGSALAVAYVWYYPSTGYVAEVDTIMNSKFFWTWSGGSSTCAYPDSYDAQAILTHELGHWFGLDDHYTGEYINNTMYGYGYKADAKAVTLTGGDISGLEAIYKK